MYVAIFIIACALLATDYFRLSILRHFCIWLFITLFSILVFLRPEYGLKIDYYEYLDFFQNVTLYNFTGVASQHGFETGFALLSAFIKTLSDSERICFAVISFLTLYISYRAINKLSKLPAYSFFIFILSFGVYLFLGQIRQGLALAFALLAVSFWLDNRPKLFFITAVIAVLFHITAVIIFIVPFVRYINIRFLYLVGLASFSLVFVDIFKPAILFVSAHLNLGDFASGKLAAYSESIYAEKVGFSAIQLYYLLLMSVLVYFRGRGITDEKFSFMLKVFIVGVVLNFAFNSFSVMLRLSYYFLVFDCILISYFIFQLKSYYEKSFFYFLFLLVFILRFSLQWLEWNAA